MTLGTTTDIQHSTTLTRRTSVGATPETKMLYLHVKSEHKLLEVAKKKKDQVSDWGFTSTCVDDNEHITANVFFISGGNTLLYLDAKCKMNGTQSRDLKSANKH